MAGERKRLFTRLKRNGKYPYEDFLRELDEAATKLEEALNQIEELKTRIEALENP